MNEKTIITTLKNYSPILIPETASTAAVLVLLVFQENNCFILLTQRSTSLATYAGDYCFPGGVREGSKESFLETAVREVYEEIGLTEKNYNLMGQLDDFHDRYGNLVRPFTAYATMEEIEKNHKKTDAEIEKIYYLPLSELNDIKPNKELEQITRRSPSYYYKKEDVIIWGLTASILVHLKNILKT